MDFEQWWQKEKSKIYMGGLSEKQIAYRGFQQGQVTIKQIIESKIDDLHEEYNDFWKSVGSCNDHGDKEGVERNKKEMRIIQKIIESLEEILEKT